MNKLKKAKEEGWESCPSCECGGDKHTYEYGFDAGVKAQQDLLKNNKEVFEALDDIDNGIISSERIDTIRKALMGTRA